MAIERYNRKSNPIKTSWLLGALLIVIVLFFALEFLDFEATTDSKKETLIELDTSGIYEIDFHTNNDFYRLTKELTEVWKINDSISINQEKVANYLGQYAKIEAPVYTSAFDVAKIPSSDKDTLIIKSADFPINLKLYCYKINKPNSLFILQSSQEPELFFQSNQMMVHQIFCLLDNKCIRH